MFKKLELDAVRKLFSGPGKTKRQKTWFYSLDYRPIGKPENAIESCQPKPLNQAIEIQ